MPSEVPVTQLLRESRNGSSAALQLLLPIVYTQLHEIASHHMRKERDSHTLSATALVHEAYLKLAGSEANLEDRKHFFALASLKMRQILVDYARARQSGKRGGGFERLSVSGLDPADPRECATILELDAALNRLADQDARKARVLELIY